MADKQAKKVKPRRMINGSFPKPPFWMLAVGGVGVCGTWLLLSFALRARTATMPHPRIHLIQDMDAQPKYKAQSENILFADGRAARPEIPGTVARGQYNADPMYIDGFSRSWNAAEKKWDVVYATDFPETITFDEAFVRHGEEKFNTYCAPCHGWNGQGNGPINIRAQQLQGNGTEGMEWVQPANLTDEERRGRPDGHLYNTITNGIRSMAGYRSQITDPHDRWAIVSYVRALQLAQHAPPDVVGQTSASAQ